MSSREVRDIRRALLAKGFAQNDTHHKVFELKLPGLRVKVFTFLSHGIQEYGDSLLAQMARQLQLTKGELLDLVDCRLSGAQYQEVLKRKGLLD